MKNTKSQKESGWIKLFLSIIRDAYLGKKFTYKKRTFKLKPKLVAPYDFSKKIRHPTDDYEKLVAPLDHFSKTQPDPQCIPQGLITYGR